LLLLGRFLERREAMEVQKLKREEWESMAKQSACKTTAEKLQSNSWHRQLR